MSSAIDVTSRLHTVPRDAGSGHSLLQQLYEPIAQELAEVEQILRAELRSDFPFVDELVRYGCLLGGKRLRPALLLLAAQATGRIQREHLVLAAVVEMIHTATLVHDDVLDEADLRRHLATVNARWDNETSILLGDFLFTHAFYLASTLDSTLACRMIGRATNIVCEGELRQKGSRADYGISERDYFGILEAKTGELCACSCHLGARMAGAAEETIRQCDTYGRHLGIAFQIADDLLDVTGIERETGKSLGTDLQKQKPTLPLIRLLRVATQTDRDEVLGILNEERADRHQALASFFERYGAVAYAQDQARQFASHARRQLDGLPRTQAREILALLTEFVVSRSQ